MEFTDSDKAYLRKQYGNEKAFQEDLPYLMIWADRTRYELLKKDGSLEKRISRASAIRLLGRNGWLSGIVRATFHWTAMRELPNGKLVYFDASRHC